MLPGILTEQLPGRSNYSMNLANSYMPKRRLRTDWISTVRWTMPKSFAEIVPQCSPVYLIEVPLDKAIGFEPNAAELLTAAEYNRLAVLGSSIWDFQKTEQYANKALAKSKTPLDGFVSHLVLAHNTFRHLNDDPERAKIKDGRYHFGQAVASLQTNIGTDAGQYHSGEGYGIWAMHEAFLKNDKDCKQMRGFADSAWSKLPNGSALLKELDERIKIAGGGVRPEIACLFKSEATPESVFIVRGPLTPSVTSVPASIPPIPTSKPPAHAPTIPIAPPKPK